MNKKFKLLVKRVIAIVLMVLMLPISAMADSFSMVVHAQPAEDYESLTEDEFDESSLIAEEEIGTDDWNGEEDDSLQTNIDNLSENVQIGQEEGEKEKSSNEEMGENETENLILGTSLGNSENSDDEEESEDSNNNQLSEVIPETISATTKLCDDGSIMFSWASLEDDELYYDVFRNQELIKTLVPDDYKKNPDDEDYDSNQISYTDENTEAAAEYTYYVVARKGEEKIAKCMDAVISMPNNLTITGDYTLTEDLTVYSIVQTAGTLNLNGHMLKVCKDYVNNTNWDGGIVFSNGAMECYGNFNIGGYYIPFKMASANDYLYVRGDFNMLSDYRNDFSNGMIETEGNFNAPYYRGSGYNKVVLRGSARQEIIVNQDCYFKNLSIQNYSEEGVNFTNPVQIGSYDDLTNIHVYINNKQTINGWTLEEDTVIEGDLCLGYGELNLNGNKLSITGNLYQVAGKLIVGDGELSIAGDYVLGTPQYDEENNVTSFKTGTGILSMQNEDGYVLVNGDFKTYSMMSESGYLSNGTMEIKGDFNIYSNNSQNFYTSGKHTVVFSGESEQTVSFATSNSSNSHFTNVINNNSSDEGLIFTDKGGSWPFANGTVKDNGRLIGGYISINGSTSFEDNHYCGSVVVSEDCTITKELMVEGNYWIGSYRVYVDAPIFVESDLYVESRYTYFRTNITVDGNMYFGGYYDSYIYLYLCSGETVVNGDCVVKLTSSWNTSTIQYEGNATFEVLGDVTLNLACYITGSNGVLKLHGDLIGNGQTSLNSNNKIVFCGDKKQSVAIAKNSTFGLFDILNESEEGVECDYLYSVGTLTRNGNKLSYKDSEGVFGWTLTEDTVIEGNLVLLDDTLDLNGHELKVEGDFIQLSGTVNINKGNLLIEGDYRNQQRSGNAEIGYSYSNGSGLLKMVNEEDYMFVKGDFISQTKINHSGYLTNGTLEVKGDFNVSNSGSGYAFVSTNNHKVVFSGNDAQKVQITGSSSSTSRFANIDFKNESEAGVVLIDSSGWPFVNGTVNDCENVVTGYLSIVASTTFENNHFSGSVVVSNDCTLTKELTVEGDFWIGSYRVYVDAPIRVKTNLYVESRYTYFRTDITVDGNMYFGGHYDSYIYLYLCSGETVVNGDCIVKLTSSWNTTTIQYEGNATLDVKGDITLDSACYMTGTCGTCKVEGDLLGNGQVSLSLNNKVIFNGNHKQMVSVASNSTFGTIEVSNESEDGVELAYVYTVSNYLRHNNKVLFSGVEGDFGWKLQEDTIIEGDFILLGDNLDLNGYKMTVTGDFIHSAGTVTVNNGELVIEGDYRQEYRKGNVGSYTYSVSGALLEMKNTDDYMFVKGDFISQTKINHSGYLTNGTLEVKGDFNVSNSGSGYAFVSTNNHKVVFSGNDAQKVQITGSSSSASRFANIDFKNESEAGVELIDSSGWPFVNGTVNDCENVVTGYLSIVASTTFENNHFSGSVVVSNDCTLTKELTVEGDFWIGSYRVYVDAPIRVKTNLYVESRYTYFRTDITVDGNMYFGGHYDSYIYLYLCSGETVVNGDCIVKLTSSWNTTTIQYSGDAIFTTKGKVTFGDACYFTGSVGTWYVGGDVVCSQNSGITLSSQHKTIFNGSEYQSVDINASSYFANVEIANTSKEGVYFARMINRNSFVKNGCKVSFGDMKMELGWTLSEDEVYDGDFILWEDTLDLNGHKLTVNGNFIAMGGNVNINGGQLIVNGDMRIQSMDDSYSQTVYSSSSANLLMKNENDYVYVDGDFYFQPLHSSNGNLTAGTFEIKGNFTQIGSNPYVGTEDNTIKFSGTEKQVYQTITNSTFANFVNQNKSELNVNSSYAVTGIVSDETENITGGGYLQTANLNNIDNGVFSGNVSLTGSCTLNKDVSIGQSLSVNNALHMNGQKLNVSNLTLEKEIYIDGGTLSVTNNVQVNYNGCLIMQKEADYVLVGGNFTFETRYNHSNYLTAGILEIRGNICQRYYSNFIATGTHTTILSRKMNTSGREFVQSISFEAYAGTTRFNKLVLKKRSQEYNFNYSVNSIANEVVYAIDDSNAPSEVVYLIAESTTEKSVKLAFGGAEDDNGILGYEIYRDGELVGVTSNSSFVDNSVSPDTKYVYRVYAFDNERNMATDSPALTVRTLPDTEAPTIPSSLSVKTKTGSSVTLSWSASNDNIKVIGYKVFKNGEMIADELSSTTFKVENLSENEIYKFSVSAYDAVGNESEKSQEIETDVAMPEIIKMEPADNQTIGGESQSIIVYFKNVGNSTGNKVDLDVFNDESEEWDNIVSKLSQKVYSGNVLYAKYDYDLTEVEGEAEKKIRATLTDADGNQTSLIQVYYIDREAPNAVENLIAQSDNGNINISFDASVSADAEKYNIYRTDSSETKLIATLLGRYETQFIDRNVEIGETYSYFVTAFDKFGNVSDASNIVSALNERDEKAPEIKDITPKSSRINGTVNVVIEAKDNKSVAKIGLVYRPSDSEEWIDYSEKDAFGDKATIKLDTTEFEDGEYYFSAYAIDDSNNKSTELFTRRYEIDNTGIGQIKITNSQAGSSFARLDWEDVDEEDFGYFAVEQLIGEEFVVVGEVSDTLGMYVNDLKTEEEYTFRVVGYDNIGNRGIPSDEITVVTVKDTIAPYITAVYPEVSKYNNAIPLKVDIGDDNGVDYAVFSYSLDGEEFVDLARSYSISRSTKESLSYDFDISSIREGKIFIKVECYDLSGNKNVPLEDGSEVIVEYEIDKTAPLKVNNLYSGENDGFVSLEWAEPSDEDVKYFKIYRADNTNGIYSLIASECTTINYYDTSVRVGNTYIYKVSAVDMAGNEGECSDEIIVTVAKDTTSPVIYGINPDSGSAVGLNPVINIVSQDNSGVASVRLEYTSDSLKNVWTRIGTAQASSNYCSTDITWNTEGLDEGEYKLRAIATDIYGNASYEYLVNYTLDLTSPTIDEFSAKTGHFEINLAASCNDEDFYYFEFQRREVGSTGYTTLIKTYDETYVDADVEIGKNYIYRVVCYDKAGNKMISDEVSSYADSVDTVAPVAVLPENIIGMVGYEIGLDGLCSSDNVRIVDYEWKMGNGDVLHGATPKYTYNSAGNYTISLTVKDEAGNTDVTQTVIRVYEKSGKGLTKVQIVDEKGIGIPFAYVYLENSDDSTMSLQADSQGWVDIVCDTGAAYISAYKANYLPSELDIFVNEYETKEYKLTLVEDELIVGSLTVHRMSLAEMVAAGVDFSNSANYYTYTFTVKLTFEKREYSVECWANYGGMYGNRGNNVRINGGAGGGSNPGSVPYEHSLYIQPVIPEEDNLQEDVYKPVITTIDSIKWLKDMYEVRLSVINQAEYQFKIENSSAKINYPSGVSLAATTSGQSRTQGMGTIHGQESKTVSWVLKGDRRGEYQVTADFYGTLMPFEVPVSAHFVADTSFEVTAGEGIHITVMPEETAVYGEKYYIQYQITNGTDHPLYNFSTTIGAYQEPDSVYTYENVDTGEKERYEVDAHFSDPSQVSQAVIVTDGKIMSFETLFPGQSFYGTYVQDCDFQSPDGSDDDRTYWELVEAMASCIGTDNLGVTVGISPIAGHVNKTFYSYSEPEAEVGDPIDISTGYFTDSVTPISVNGATMLGLDMTYSSGNTDYLGEMGYGWYNEYEMKLVEHNGIIWFYTNPGGIVSFISDNALNGNIYGSRVGDTLNIATGVEYSYGTYSCLNCNMADYMLTKSASGYEITMPSGAKYVFDIDGRLIRIVTAEKQTISISYSGSNTIVKEDVSGKTLTLSHENGLLTKVSDNTGRAAYFVYDNNSNLTAIVLPDGSIRNYTYNDAHKIVSESNANGTFVSNTYDDKGRVLSQNDALGRNVRLSYEDLERSTNVTYVDAKGVSQSVNTDQSGKIKYVVNADGGVTNYTYDLMGNVLSERDALGNVLLKEYDDNGFLNKITDKSGYVTRMTYDSKGNVLSITSDDGRTAYYSYDSDCHMISSIDVSGMKSTYTYDSNGQMTSQTVEGLGTTYYTYEAGMLTAVTDNKGNITKFYYDDCGNQIKSVDALGNISITEYDLLGRVISETDALGNKTFYSYDVNGNRVTVTDALGNVTKYSYDVKSNLTAATYADGTQIYYAYDANNRCTKVTYADGTYTSYEYDAVGNLIKETSSEGTSVTYTYDLLGQCSSCTDNTGKKVSYEYYPNGNLYKKIYSDGTYDLYTYNMSWQLITLIDSYGNAVSYSYNKAGKVTKATDELGNNLKNEYDTYGRLLSETDPNGNVTKYSYDTNGNCVSKTNAAGTTVYMVYDALNRMTSAYSYVNGEKYTISYEYDALGRVIATTDEEGYRTSVNYDAMGNPVSVTDANGNTSSTSSYDAMGRVSSTTDALGIKTEYTYDVVGNLLSVAQNVNGEEDKISYDYDSFGRLISVNENGITTKQTYDIYGNITSVTDANGGVTSYTYDSDNRLISEVSALGNATSYTYNAKGLLDTITNERGQIGTYIYDAIGRVTSYTDELGTVNYSYDANGNILTVKDSNGTIKRTYDKLNRVTSYTDYNGNCIKYSYDELGNLISLTYPGGEIVRYEYYKNGWLKNVIDNEENITSYTYDALGNMLTCTRPNGTKEIRSYDNDGNLINQREIKTDAAESGVVELSNYKYAYDGNGNITSIEGFETTDTESGIANLKSSSFEYDSENRLVKYNGKTVEYDRSGNMTYGPVDDVMSELTYDCRNRLVSAGGVTYTYDAENNRIASETANTRIEYVVDTVSSELSRVLEETSYKKKSNSFEKETTRIYIYGVGLLCEKEGSKAYYHHYNNLGSTMKLSDESGRIVETYTYGTYGELLSGDTSYTHYLYNGSCGVSTDANGLYYMRQRYYNTEIKRFVNQDILSGSIDNSKSLNRYSYVQGNPVSYTDPFGLSPEQESNVASTVAHTIFGFLGCVPGVVGCAANLADCILYAAEGDYVNAALSGICALSMGVASIAVRGGATAMKVAKGAMYVARAADLASNAYAFCVGAHDTAEQIKTIQQKLYNGESVSADEYGRMALSAICTVISGVSTAASLKGFGTVDDDLALLASKYKKVAPEIDNPTTTKMTGGVDKTPDVEIKSKSSEPSMEYNLQLFAKKADDAYQGSTGSVPNSGQGFSPKGYNPQPGERTFKGYVKQTSDPEISLYTKSSGFNNNSKGVGGQFKRFGANEHYGLSPHVHQPIRNPSHNGMIFGRTGKDVGVDVFSPTKRDIKQLYEYLNNGKYHQ